MATPDDLPTVPTGPAPVTVPPDIWTLRAAPGTLESAARSWRLLRDGAQTAETTLGDAAAHVIGGGGWSGQTAESYDGHQRKVTGGLDALATEAETIAGTLEELARILRVNQDALDEEAEKLSGIPADGLTLRPETEAQAERAREAITAAGEIHSYVDEQLALRQPVLDGALERLHQIADDWQPRTVGMLNLNIGQGYKNEPWNSEGTDHGDIGSVADTIVDADADIVTLQEIFGEEAENLERELEARTGDEWTVHFGETRSTIYWSDGVLPRSLSAPVGNAVAVRHGGAIDSSQTVANHDLNAPGKVIDTPQGPITDGEERSALEVEVTFGGW